MKKKPWYKQRTFWIAVVGGATTIVAYFVGEEKAAQISAALTTIVSIIFIRFGVENAKA